MVETTLKPQVIAGMDPRIRRRRLDVRRQEGRRRLRVLTGLLVAAGLAGGGWGALHSPVLDVDRVVVSGVVHTDPAEVVRGSGIRRGDALVDVRPAAAVAGVARLPWVAEVTVRRQWPGTVVVRVAERAPVAAARAGQNEWALVDADSRVLARATATEPPAGLPAVSSPDPVGPPGSRLGPGWSAVLEVATKAPPPVLARVGTVADVAGEVELALTSGGVVRFGSPEQVGEKFTAIAAVLAQVDLKDLAVLDVRIPRTPVLTRQQAADKVSTRTTG